MATKGKGKTPNDWVIEDGASKGRSANHSSRGNREAARWLAVPPPKPRDVLEEADNGTDSPEEEAPRERPLSRGISMLFSSQRERRLSAELRQAEAELEAQREEIDELNARIKSLEAQTRRRKARSSAQSRKKSGRRVKRPSAS